MPHLLVCQACGARVQDYKNADGGKEGLVLGVKDVADMLDFDEQQARAAFVAACSSRVPFVPGGACCRCFLFLIPFITLALLYRSLPVVHQTRGDMAGTPPPSPLWRLLRFLLLLL